MTAYETLTREQHEIVVIGAALAQIPPQLRFDTLQSMINAKPSRKAAVVQAIIAHWGVLMQRHAAATFHPADTPDELQPAPAWRVGPITVGGKQVTT